MSHLIAANVIQFIKTTKEYQQEKRHWAKHYTKRCRLNTCFLMVDQRYLVWYIISKKEFFRTRHPSLPLSINIRSQWELMFTCTLRLLFHNSDTFTLQNKHTIKKNLHFSLIFSLFHLISFHILIGTHPFGAPSITFFHGESQSNISPLLPQIYNKHISTLKHLTPPRKSRSIPTNKNLFLSLYPL